MCMTRVNKYSFVFSTELCDILHVLYGISSWHIKIAIIITESIGASRSVKNTDWKRWQLVNKTSFKNLFLSASGSTVPFL